MHRNEIRPNEPNKWKKAPCPRPGQGQDGQRNIYYGDGFPELKDLRKRKGFKYRCGTSWIHTYPVWTDLQFGPGSPGQWWARHKIRECTRAGEKTEKNRQNKKGMVRNMTLRKGQWLSEDSGRLQQRNTAPLSATFTKKHSRCSHSTGSSSVWAGDCSEAPQHILCKIWALCKCPSCGWI